MAAATTTTRPDIQPSLAVDSGLAMDQFNQLLIAQFRANGGKLSGQFSGAPIPLLNAIGARSGATRPKCFEVKHRRGEGEQRDRLWHRIVAQWPMAADYQKATPRRIPVILLERGEN